MAKVEESSPEELQACIEAIGQRHPILQQEKVWGAMDGLKLPLQAPGIYLVQTQYFNGWAGGTFVGSVFAFAPAGLIRCCTINAPGSMHDSTLADHGTYATLEDMNNKCQ